MKIKWLVILFIFYIGIVLISLLFTHKNNKLTALMQKATPITEQSESAMQPFFPPAKTLVSTAVSLPLIKSGITIIKTPAIEPENAMISYVEVKEEMVNNPSSRNVSLNTNVEDDAQPQAGITKIGKQPSLKEVKEMNSNGIVLY